jgi:hypothetical protein
MVDYYPIRSNNRKLPNPEPEDNQEAQQPVVVDLVYNEFEERNGTTIAIKVSFHVPRHHTRVPAANR